VIETLGRARFGSFTLAPEAGSDRMRRFINKGNTDQDLYASAQKVFESGWHAIKLYFMLGLPGETEEDLEGIVEIANRCRDIGRRYHRRPEITVSTSTFVPKAHTPFQWERQISIDEVHARQQYLKKRLRGPGLSYRWHDAGKSFLEGVFSRGGQELAAVTWRAHEKGARFDAWEERFDLSRWLSAFDEVGIDPNEYLKERDRDTAFPWDHLGVGPDRDFLWRERERARELATTPDCTVGSCSHCGICDFHEVKNRVADRGDACPERSEGTQGNHGILRSAQDDNKGRSQDQTYRYRVRYHKKGRAAFLGHQETSGALRRAVRAAGLPLIYSQGFHPRVRISFGPALPVGVESEAEFADVWLCKPVDSKKVIRRLNDHLPEGMRVIAAGPFSKITSSIDEDIASMTYQIDLSPSAIDIGDGVRRFDAAQRVLFTRVRPEGQQVVDLKEAVGRLAVVGHGVIELACLNRPPRPKVGELLQGVFGLSEDSARALCVRKVAVEWK
jgi:radical SAM-linked protein